jgi:hypothetical protein
MFFPRPHLGVQLVPLLEGHVQLPLELGHLQGEVRPAAGRAGLRVRCACTAARMRARGRPGLERSPNH